ncbi:hypothetical protein AB205_0113400, partial [Aquarana catesbeiana]
LRPRASRRSQGTEPGTERLRWRTEPSDTAGDIAGSRGQVGPPALLPLYFQWYIFYFVVQRKKLVADTYSSKYFWFIESNWSVWVTQMNHIPMHIDYDQTKEWLSGQFYQGVWGAVAGCIPAQVMSDLSASLPNQ